MTKKRGRPPMDYDLKKRFIRAWMNPIAYPTSADVGRAVGISADGARSLAKRMRKNNSLPCRRDGPTFEHIWYL